MKGGWIIPAGWFLQKIMHIYESSSMILGPLQTVSSEQRGIFPFGSEWSQLSFHYFARLSSHHFPPPNSLSESRYLGSLPARKRTKHFFSPYHPTTFSQVLKRFYIRPPLSPTLSLPFLSPLYPVNGHFHLKDAWCLSDDMLEKVLSLSPSGGNGFWVVGCDRNSLCCLSERPVSGWENSTASIS